MWDRKPRDRRCTFDGCKGPHHAHGYCSTHWQRIKKHGDPLRVDSQDGENNPSWLGDEVGYYGAHERVRRLHGPASTHRCRICDKKARHWAYNHAAPEDRVAIVRGVPYPYSPNPVYYIPLCVRCHKYLDLGRRAASIKNG